jgi:hypothetical protein
MSTPLQLPPLAQAYMDNVAKKHNPKAQVLRKSDSWLMRAAAFILKPFNPTFLNQYITTIGATIYVPDDFLTTFDETSVLDTVTHETQHIIDYTANPPLFVLSYLFPLPLALLSLLAFGAFWSPWMLLWLLALGFLAPIPSPGRYKAELHGYRTTVLFARKVWKYNDDQMPQVYDWVADQMATGAYYWAWPFKDKVRADLKDESFMNEPRYQEITQFLTDHGIIS